MKKLKAIAKKIKNKNNKRHAKLVNKNGNPTNPPPKNMGKLVNQPKVPANRGKPSGRTLRKI